MQTLWQDLRYGARMLVKKPGFTAVAMTVLALGIGANTMIFSVVNAVLLRPLPFATAQRLVSVTETNADGQPARVSPANFVAWQEQGHVFERLVAFEFDSFNLAGGSQPESVMGAWVSAEMFRALGVEATLGRAFLPDEDQPGAERVAVLTHGLWARRFGADPHIIGKQVTLYGLDNPNASAIYTVVGVLPQSFWFVSGQFEVYVPHQFTAAQLGNRAARSQQVFGLLKPGVTLEQANAEMATIASRLAQEYPEANNGRGARVTPLQEALTGEFGAAMLVVLGAVCFVLLIACANVANLLLARAATRQKEMAIRSALGAGRWRLVRQLLTESMLLAVLGGGLGLLLAVWSVDLALALIPGEARSFIPGGAQAIALDRRVLGFTLGGSVATGILFGLAPALTATRVSLSAALKGGGFSSAPRRQRLQGALVIAEVALCLVLLISAGLLMKSFLQMQRADLGFNPERILRADISLPRGKYAEGPQQAAFFRQILQRVETLPGVESASLSSTYPTRPPGRTLFVIEGRPAPDPDAMPAADNISISPGYFHTLGVPLLKGRAFTEQDTAQSLPVAIISETTARRYWPDEDPIGKRLRQGNLQSQAAWVTIVGVVPDVRQELSPEPVYPALYRPYAQQPQFFMYLLARAASDPLSLTAAVREQARALDPDQPLAGVASLEQAISGVIWGQRFLALLFGIFGAVAMAMAAIGIYGVISYAVTQRTQEIGIRAALGAEPRAILTLIVAQGMRLTLVGIVLGLVGSLAATQVLSGLLYGVSATDPMTFAVIALLLAGVALLACYLPARRATKVDPMTALRHE